MNTTNVNAYELQLRCIMISAWKTYGESIGTDAESATKERAEESTKAYCDFSVGNSSALAAPRCEPPEGQRQGDTFHWLKDPKLASGRTIGWWSGEAWMLSGDSGYYFPEAIAPITYGKPVIPVEPQTLGEPSDAEKAAMATYDYIVAWKANPIHRKSLAMDRLWRKMVEACHAWHNRTSNDSEPEVSELQPFWNTEPTMETVRALIEQLPRGTIWHTQINELIEYTKLALVKFGGQKP